jgi:hypothetical protein
MFYEPPKKWIEELVDELPSEDDRYEWKSGDEIAKNELDDFSKNISKEIGAFANSFGGTLFIGISDDRTKVGIPAIAKGRTPTERWLENKIPVLLEMRLQRFRVTRVELTEKSQGQIGSDRIVVAIDILDSDLAPHQCVFDQRYYYRINSSSVPAPHHYLAFLWGRASSNMPHVASWWLTDFLSPLISLISDTGKNFNKYAFVLRASKIQSYGIDVTYEIEFFERNKWNEILCASAGEYFLSTFPLIQDELTSFEKTMSDFESALSKLLAKIEGSAVFLRQLKDIYERLVSRERIPRSEFENFDVQEMSVRVLGQLHMPISKYPWECKDNLGRFTAYALLELGLSFPVNAMPDDQGIVSFCKELSSGITQDETVIGYIPEVKRLYELIQRESSRLVMQLKRERIDIAKRYTAPFKD